MGWSISGIAIGAMTRLEEKFVIQGEHDSICNDYRMVNVFFFLLDGWKDEEMN